VHCLQLKATRDWFLPQGKKFPLRTTRTKTGPINYTTVGALVPLRVVKQALKPQVWSRTSSKPSPMGEGAAKRRMRARPNSTP
jgi:hypothetical protein